MFDPSIGKWISQDPEGFAAGDGNLYRYVGNDPTNGVDPSGLQPPPKVVPVVPKLETEEPPLAKILTKAEIEEKKAQIKKLIDDLGHKRYQVREKALDKGRKIMEGVWGAQQKEILSPLLDITVDENPNAAEIRYRGNKLLKPGSDQ